MSHKRKFSQLCIDLEKDDIFHKTKLNIIEAIPKGPTCFPQILDSELHAFAKKLFANDNMVNYYNRLVSQKKSKIGVYSSSLGYFQVLPEPILKIILSFLVDEYNDENQVCLGSLRLTCKSFNSLIVNNYWCQPLSVFNFNLYLNQINKKRSILCPSIHLLRINMNSLNELNGLKDLPLTNLNLEMVDEDSNEILQFLPSTLQSLKINTFIDQEIIDFPPSLKRLSFVLCQYNTSKDFVLSLPKHIQISYSEPDYYYSILSFVIQLAICHNVVENWIEIISLLIQKGYDVNEPSYTDGATPIIIACQNGKLEIVKLLLENGADYNKPCNDGFSPLIIASQSGYLEIVKLLLTQKRIDPNKIYPNNNISALFFACNYGYLEIVKVLIENGADPNKPCDGVTPLFIACQQIKLEVVKLLLQYGADPNKTFSEGRVPLFIASQMKQVEMVQILLQYGADPNKISINATPLFIACEKDQTEIVKLLVQFGANINTTLLNDGTTPLSIACEKGHIQIVKFLLQNGANPNKTCCSDGKPCDGCTPLIITCRYNNNQIDKDTIIKLLRQTAIIKLLLENGADPNKTCSNTGKPCNDGFTPLSITCQYNHKKNITQFENDYMLHNIHTNSCENQIEIVRILLENDADPNKLVFTTNGFTTPLLMACKQNHVEIVKLLLENGADPNKYTIDNNAITHSPLSTAYENKQMEIIQLLIKYNVDL